MATRGEAAGRKKGQVPDHVRYFLFPNPRGADISTATGGFRSRLTPNAHFLDYWDADEDRWIADPSLIEYLAGQSAPGEAIEVTAEQMDAFTKKSHQRA